ncbi:hypothetical protein LINGRAHAP2_LOCUS31356 [Linum grandiflorum]
MVWVALPDLPIEFYNPTAVLRIASRIGNLVYKGGSTRKVCTCVRQSRFVKAVVPTYKIEGIKYLIKYEGLHDICTACAKFGYLVSRCPCKDPLSAEPMTQDQDSAEHTDVMEIPEKGAFGAWMMPKHKGKWKRVVKRNMHEQSEIPKSNVQRKYQPMSSNRFNILQHVEGVEINEQLATGASGEIPIQSAEGIEEGSGGGTSRFPCNQVGEVIMTANVVVSEGGTKIDKGKKTNSDGRISVNLAKQASEVAGDPRMLTPLSNIRPNKNTSVSQTPKYKLDGARNRSPLVNR